VLAAPEDPPHRQAQATGEIIGLVESALKGPPRMQWHGHDGIRLGDQIRSSPTHQSA
jgi:hypothetical protein